MTEAAKSCHRAFFFYTTSFPLSSPVIHVGSSEYPCRSLKTIYRLCTVALGSRRGRKPYLALPVQRPVSVVAANEDGKVLDWTAHGKLALIYYYQSVKLNQIRPGRPDITKSHRRVVICQERVRVLQEPPSSRRTLAGRIQRAAFLDACSGHRLICHGHGLHVAREVGDDPVFDEHRERGWRLGDVSPLCMGTPTRRAERRDPKTRRKPFDCIRHRSELRRFAAFGHGCGTSGRLKS